MDQIPQRYDRGDLSPAERDRLAAMRRADHADPAYRRALYRHAVESGAWDPDAHTPAATRAAQRHADMTLRGQYHAAEVYLASWVKRHQPAQRVRHCSANGRAPRRSPRARTTSRRCAARATADPDPAEPSDHASDVEVWS